MTKETLERANDLVRKTQRLNVQLKRTIEAQERGGPFGIFGEIDVRLHDLPPEAEAAVYAVIINALESELAKTANELAAL
ncbi:hypothetical protein [Allofournierella sp.]|uniref:hypothetical protein n=1 Tax=Allofournierella sp. TaxID=1940256 RepID=UPI003AB5E5FE